VAEQLFAIGSSLISTFTIHTSTAKWVSYQFLASAGRGRSLQMMGLISSRSSFSQQILTAISPAHRRHPKHPPTRADPCRDVSCCLPPNIWWITFPHLYTDDNRPQSYGLKKCASTVNAQSVTTAGATAVRQVVNPGEVLGVLEACNLAIDRGFCLVVE